MNQKEVYDTYQRAANITLKGDNYHEIVGYTKPRFDPRYNGVFNQIKELQIRKILDVGCGSGLYLKKLKDLGFDVKGIDFSHNQIRNCKNLFGLTDDEVSIGDMFDLKFEKNSFDLVLCIGLLLNLDNADDFKKVFRELTRVSRKYIMVDFENTSFFINKFIGHRNKNLFNKKLIADLMQENHLKMLSQKMFAINKILNRLCKIGLLAKTNIFHEYSMILFEK